MLPFRPHAFQMNVQLHPLSHRSLSFQDHVYELLNTIDACQCFFDIVSINVAILSHFKQLSPTPEAQVCLVYYCHDEVTLAELYCFTLAVHDLYSGTCVSADLIFIFCI